MTDSRSLSQERFGALAQNYVTSHVHGTGYNLGRLIELVQPSQGKLALDIATGGGHVALRLAQGGAVTLASDITVNMLRSAYTHLTESGVTASFGRVEASHLPFADRSLDIVTVRHAPHHFPDAYRFVQEVARVLKVGGVFGLVDQIAPDHKQAAEYVNAFEKLRDPSHGWQFSLSEWVGMFQDAELEVMHQEIDTIRMDLAWWTQMQRNDADTVLRLKVILTQAPPAVREFLKPEFRADGNADFDHHYGIVLGKREG